MRVAEIVTENVVTERFRSIRWMTLSKIFDRVVVVEKDGESGWMYFDGIVGHKRFGTI